MPECDFARTIAKHHPDPPQFMIFQSALHTAGGEAVPPQLPAQPKSERGLAPTAAAAPKQQELLQRQQELLQRQAEMLPVAVGASGRGLCPFKYRESVLYLW